jgi:hypothetical protein
VQQDHRIRAAGNGNENFLAAWQQTSPGHAVINALEKFVHAAIVALFGKPGKRPADWFKARF